MKTRKLLLLSLLGLPLVMSTISCESSSVVTTRLLRTTENNDVFIGDVINVETRRLEYQGEYQDVLGVIVDPRGNSYQGRSFTVSEAGLYQVIYKAYFGHHKEEQVVNYLCKRKSQNFFTVVNPVDVSFGEYRYNSGSYHNEGVLIDVKNGSEIIFNELLSVNDFLKEQVQTRPGKGYKDRTLGATANSLIDFLIDPSEQMSTDFTAMTIRLTDSVDKSNFVDIRIEDAFNNSDKNSWTMSYVRAGASCNWQLGWEWDGSADSNPNKSNVGKFHNGISGTGLNLSYRGDHYKGIVTSAQILFSADTGRIYNYLGSLETEYSYFVNDLCDPIIYGNNAWNGFSSGKFYLSIIPTSFSNATGRILIKSVGKYKFPSEILVDSDAPTITVDTLGYDDKNLPRAAVGKSYPLFAASVFDNYDSELDYYVSVTYRDSLNKEDIDVSVIDNAFVASKSGVYSINYHAKDRSGNVADTVVKRVTTINSYNDVVLHLDTLETTVDAYEKVILPRTSEIQTMGGVENSRIAISRKVIDPRGHELILDSDEFRPTLVGDYQIIYTGSDYVGNSGELIYTVHSQELSKPVFISEPNLPAALINGFNYSFDNIKAIETKEGAISEIIPSILINGEPYTGNYLASGEKAKVTYRATGISASSDLDVDLDVIDVTSEEGGLHHSKYFVGDYDAIEDIYLETNNVTLSGGVEGYSTFINPLNPNAFYVGLHLIEGHTNFEMVSIRLTDTKDKDIHITFDIDVVNGIIYSPYLPELPFAISEGKIGLDYSDESKVFLDTSQSKLGTIIKDDKGNSFLGFKGGVYLSVGLKGVTGESKLAVEKICNQPVGYRSKGKDRIQPTIRYNSQFVSEQQKGAQFVYPTFEPFDVLSDIVEATITVVKPDNTSYSGGKDLKETFTIVQDGEYRVNYVAKDSSGNTRKINEIVAVYDDIPPVISVSNPPKSTYSLNSSFTIPKYTVSDDSDKYTVDVILILPTNEMRILTHHVHDIDADPVDVIEYALDPEKELYDPSFIVNQTTCKLQLKGTYRLRYVAYDSAYNTATLEYSFTVK